MNWTDMQKTYPNEWIALAHYKQKDAVEIEGEVVTHHTDRKTFHQAVEKLLPQYGDIAIRFTGPLIKNEEIPLLWQISDIE